MIESYPTRAEASQAAARALQDRLQDDLGTQARASLVLSGGSTPLSCLETLSQAELDWGRVEVTLTDEREVAVTDPASNEGMLRRHFFVGPAAAARFVPLKAASLEQMPRPTSAVLCGMGSDGHFASLFPDLPDLRTLLDPSGTVACARVMTTASPHPRTSLTLAWLCATRSILLLAFGADKRRILEQPQGTPVAALLLQRQAAVRILWAP